MSKYQPVSVSAYVMTISQVQSTLGLQHIATQTVACSSSAAVAGEW